MNTLNDLTNDTEIINICNITDITSFQIKSLIILDGVMATLSILGPCYMMMFYIIFKNQRNFGQKLILCLTTSDAIYATSNLLNTIKYFSRDYSFNVDNDILCYIEGHIRQFGTMLSISFADLIALNSFLCTKQSSSYLIENNQKRVFLSVLSFACMFTLIPSFIHEAYGRYGMWCGLNQSNPYSVYIFMTFATIPLFTSFILILYCYCKIRQRIHADTSIAIRIRFRLFMYLFIFVIAWIVGWNDAYYWAEEGGKCYFPFLIAHIIFTHGQGLWNALYFGWDSFADLKKLCKKWCKCCLKENLSSSILSDSQNADNSEINDISN